jgi:hypothetical protein
MHSDDNADQTNDAVYASSIQAGRWSRETHRLEHPGAIVIYRVTARELHEDEHSDADEYAFAVARGAELFQLGKQTTFTEAIPVIVDGVHDAGEFFFEVWVSQRKTSEFDKCFGCSATRSVLSEPPAIFLSAIKSTL